MFDRVVLSTDENPNYIEFWPLVCSAWKKFFPEISVSLAFVSDRTESDDLLLRMKKFGDGIEIFKTVDGIPTANHAKVARLILASEFENEVCLIHDIDTYIGIIIQIKTNNFSYNNGIEYYHFMKYIIERLDCELRFFAIQYMYNYKYHKNNNIIIYKNDYLLLTYNNKN